MTKTTEVLDGSDVCPSVDLQSGLEAKAEGAGKLIHDPGRPLPPAEGSCFPRQTQVEVQSIARTAPLAGSSRQPTVPISRKALSQKIFELLPEEFILWLGVMLPLFVLAVGHLAHFQ